MRPYFEENGITIYHGDNREVLPALPSSSVGLVITSPPYNLGEGMEEKGGFRVGHDGSKWRKNRWKYKSCAWKNSKIFDGYESYSDSLLYPEYVEWQKATLRECWRVIDDAGAIFYNHKPRVVRGEVRLPTALNPDLPLRQVVIWDRASGFNYTTGAYMPMCEWVLIFAKENFKLRDKGASGVGDVWRIAPELNTPHPAPFPLALPRQILSTTNASVVLDPFMGSGTTLRAAKDLGRKAIGIEIEERYCEIAAKRLAQGVLEFTGT